MSQILIQPVITEKSNLMSETQNKFTFKVARHAKKDEIKTAVEEMYSVTVCDIKTAIVPSKYKTRNTKQGVVQGRKSGYKKAIVTIQEGQTIELFSEI